MGGSVLDGVVNHQFKGSAHIMSKLIKATFPLIALFVVGCTIPGSKVSLDTKKIYEDKTNQDNPQYIEQVNVYPLTHEFVSGYNLNNIKSNGKTQVNYNLDAEIEAFEYKVGVGDILNITIWDHPELTIPAGSYRSAQEAGHWVHADGKIFYPYIGFVLVEGKTVVEIRSDISTRLRKFIEEPQVDVNIAAFRSQKSYITGEVKKSGKQPVTNVALTLLEAINNAGGLTNDADWRHVTLTRAGKTETLSLYKLMQKGDLTQNRLIKNGDIIHVPRNDSQKVFVLGDIKEPAMLKIDRAGMTLTEALSSVGGINELSADATGIFVVRSAKRDKSNVDFLASVREASLSDEEKEQAPKDLPVRIISNIYQLNISDASGLVIGTDFELEPYDVVYVTAAPIERYNRVIRQLMPTIGAFNQLSEGAVRVHNW